MRVLVDTCVWSLALRREPRVESPVVKELTELISESRVQIIGPIRQELLSGIRDKKQFDKLRLSLEAFPDLTLETADYECAAEFYTQCRRKGVQGSNTDFLICAVAERRNMAIFTVDHDFSQFHESFPVVLHKSRF